MTKLFKAFIVLVSLGLLFPIYADMQPNVEEADLKNLEEELRRLLEPEVSGMGEKETVAVPPSGPFDDEVEKLEIEYKGPMPEPEEFKAQPGEKEELIILEPVAEPAYEDEFGDEFEDEEIL